MQNSSCILHYNGPINDKILTQLRDKHLLHLDVPSKLERKLFMILVELGQNVAKYSAERSESTNYGIGTLTINKEQNSLIFKTQNLATKASAIKVMNRCNQLSLMDRKTLRDLRKEIMGMPFNPDHIGARLGLIQISLYAAKPLESYYEVINGREDIAQLSMAVHIAIPNK